MTTLRLWQVDAFAPRRFAGNPAAVVPLDDWLPDATLQAIAAENNLAETAFLKRLGAARWHLRWFTPTVEIRLCGHATLASGYVIDRHLEPGGATPIVFETLSGELRVERQGGRYSLDFPSYPVSRVEDPQRLAAIAAALGQAPLEVWENDMLLALLPDAAAVRAARPDIRAIAALPGDGIILTGDGPGGEGADFVSRYFVPQAGNDEDPVTGSAHCRLAPFWAARLGRTAFFARQASRRGGELWVTLAGARVHIAGEVQPYLEGRIAV